MKPLQYSSLLLLLLLMPNLLMAQAILIPIETKDFATCFEVDNGRRLWNVYFGNKLGRKSEYGQVSKQFYFSDANAGRYNNAYTPAGTWNLSEPALQITHHDGNLSTELTYISHQTVTEKAYSTTIIKLSDPVYKVAVDLYYKAWADENVIEQWAEITNNETGDIRLNKYASANLFFTGNDFYLTSFQGEYLKEMQPSEEKLLQGTKTVESKLGTRAMLLGTPNFILSFGKPASENSGLTVLGQLAWSGNFKLEFEIDPYQNLRVIAGINPYASDYALAAGKTFKTASLIYTVAGNGTGQASRQLQSWARKYRVLNGLADRQTLLNNWEATYFDFNETKLSALIKNTADLGLDLFLLDDGWFGNKYPRNNDDAGLGDWQENKKKLPNGLGYLVKEAKNNHVKFGIWIEPEMVNPQSDLYHTHLDWVIRQPQRPEKLYRNQLVLDLSNPKVQDYVYSIVDTLFQKNPDLSFVKWDCNAVIYNAYSAYLQTAQKPQSQLYVDYVKGLYAVLQRIRQKYPTVDMMLCSGGGGRADYEFLKYFTEFWPSDDTEPVERIFLQWNYSYFFPSITTDCHVTNWGKQPLKFKIDVASMGKLGFDIVPNDLSTADLTFCKEAIKNYRSFKDMVLHGTQYRLASPYQNPFASLIYINDDQSKGVMFTYLHSNRFFDNKVTKRPILLNGLDAAKNYSVKEINIYPGTKSTIDERQVYSGDFLMHVGLNPDITLNRTSVVLLITAIK